MTDAAIAALSGEPVRMSSALGAVTPNFVVVRRSDTHSHIILSLARLTDLRVVNTSYPGLLVIAAAVLVLAAAAFFSKEGSGAGLPLLLIATAFLIGFVGTRRATVVLISDSERIETLSGTPAEASAFARAVHAARGNLED